jgi:hypothetical protein
MNTKHFLIFLFAAFNIQVFSQDYEPVIKEGSFWDEGVSTGSFCGVEYYRYKIGNDILIQGKTYKKLLFAQYQYTFDNNISPCKIYTTPYVINLNKFEELDEYIREDIAEKKVYILSSKHAGNEYIEYTLYDFNLNSGDTMTNA